MNFEVYENNGGALTLFALDEIGEVVAAYGNWEYTSGSLKEAIGQLKADPDAWKTWGGDIGGDIEMPMMLELTGFEGQPGDVWDACPVYAEREMTLNDLYDEIATGGEWHERGDDRIAWSTPDGWKYDRSKMGAAGCSALGLDDDCLAEEGLKEVGGSQAAMSLADMLRASLSSTNLSLADQSRANQEAKWQPAVDKAGQKKEDETHEFD